MLRDSSAAMSLLLDLCCSGLWLVSAGRVDQWKSSNLIFKVKEWEMVSNAGLICERTLGVLGKVTAL